MRIKRYILDNLGFLTLTGKKFNELEVEKYADNYFDLKFSLEQVFQKTVDLLEDQAIKTHISDK